MAARHRTASAELSQRILDAGLAILEDEGAHALTVRHLAHKAEVAPMGIYSHFQGKHGVVDELFRRGFELLTEAIALRDVAGTPRERLRLSGMAYRAFAQREPALYRLMFLGAVPDFEPSPESAMTAALCFQTLVNHIAVAQASGDVLTGDPVDLAQEVWASVHGYVALELNGINFSSRPDDTFERLVHHVCSGLEPK